MADDVTRGRRIPKIQIFGKSGIWNIKSQNIEKIAFKVIQMKFSAMHITNQNKVLVYLQ